MSELPFAVAPVMGLLATTQLANPGGFALQNATPPILAWTAPSDGNLHRVTVIGTLDVTSGETGGAIHVALTAPDGTVTNSPVVSNGGLAAGAYALTTVTLLCKAGTSVTVQQQSALTAGAALAWFELWGSLWPRVGGCCGR